MSNVEGVETIDRETQDNYRTVERVDSHEKTTGSAVFGSDIVGEDLLHGAVVRSTHPHARVGRIDPDSLESIPGVHAVLSREDLLGEYDNRVRHYGDVVGAIAASDRETARRVARQATYDLDPLDTVFDPHEALESDAPVVHENNPDFGQHIRHPLEVDEDRFSHNLDDYHSLTVGDVEAGFDAAEVVLEEEFRTPRVTHCNLDTHCCIAEWSDQQLQITGTLTSPTQASHELAAFLGVDHNDVVVKLPPTQSSSFGGRALRKLTLEPVAASLAKATGRPVKLWFDREEEFVAAESRHVTHYSVKIGMTEGGEITALDLTLVADTGGYPNGVGHIVLASGRDRPLDLYDIPNYRFEGMSCFTNNPPAGEYRGIGTTQVMFVLESAIDESARLLGMDPVRFRELNFRADGDAHPLADDPSSTDGLFQCLNAAKARMPNRRSSEDGNRSFGWGVAAGAHPTDGTPGEDIAEVKLRLGSDGRVQVQSASADQGQGSDTVLAQIVAAETGIPTSQVEVKRFETTDDIEDRWGSVASRTTFIIGRAVRQAAKNLASDLRDAYRAGHEAESGEITVEDGTIQSPGHPSVPVGDLVPNSGILEARGRVQTSEKPTSYGVHLAEVSVDTVTGQVDVLQYLAAQDIGYAINPPMVEGQLEGAVLHGIEFALYSEFDLDNGTPVNANLADYPSISALEMPGELDCQLVESNSDIGPDGAKGVGTPSLPPVAPAVLNAVRAATGQRITDPPATPEKIWMSLEGGRR